MTMAVASHYHYLVGRGFTILLPILSGFIIRIHSGNSISNTRFIANGHHHPNEGRQFIYGECQDRFEFERQQRQHNNNISVLFSSRGGAIAKEFTTSIITSTSTLNDDDVDQLVDELIASVNTDGGGGDDDDEDRRPKKLIKGCVVELEPADDDEVGSEGEKVEQMVIRGTDADTENERHVEESAGAKQNGYSSLASTTSPVRYNDRLSPNNHHPHQHSFSTLRPNNDGFSSLPSTTTPTNAYYRFIVRRGPVGHIVASSTLVAVQWIHTYVPYLYQLMSFILLKFRIYNPQLLHERDRKQQQQQQRLRSRSRYNTATTTNKKSGGLLKSKFNFFRKSKQEEHHHHHQQQQKQQQQAMLQKHADELAANKLKQLYKTMKTGGAGFGMLSEVKYRYLSVAFRRKHGLGKEYCMEKPRNFMGEIIVMGSLGTGTTDENLGVGLSSLEDFISVDESNEREGVVGQHKSISGVRSDKSKRGRRQRVQTLRGKQKVNSDWVVEAFSRRHPPRYTNFEALSTTANTTSGKVNNMVPITSLWTAVDRDAIVEAAHASRVADASVDRREGSRGGVVSHGRIIRGNNDDDDSPLGIEAGSGAGSSAYSASKMFQSVITRVGSNGRVFGAYPNDALPIEQCAHERGVVGLASKYGYGDWKTASGDREDSDDNEGNDDLWGGDLDFE